jgi:hypothetical protein
MGRSKTKAMMGRHKHEKDKGRLGPFVPLLKDTLDAPAWRAMSHGARSLYVALKRRYNQNNHNNGRLFLSLRDAEKELGSHHNQIVRWYRELQHYGFIVLQTAGVLGVEGRGQAPRWRLTELGYMRDPPTRDFLCWDGKRFKKSQPHAPTTKTESRARFRAHPALESAHTPALENAPTKSELRWKTRTKEWAMSALENAPILSVTTPPDIRAPLSPRPRARFRAPFSDRPYAGERRQQVA